MSSLFRLGKQRSHLEGTAPVIYSLFDLAVVSPNYYLNRLVDFDALVARASCEFMIALSCCC